MEDEWVDLMLTKAGVERKTEDQGLFSIGWIGKAAMTRTKL